jgi:hypothetical protein
VIDIPSWTHIDDGQFPPTPKGRELAIERMFDGYEWYRGKRRADSRKAFEVYLTKYDVRRGGWVLYVRRRRR